MIRMGSGLSGKSAGMFACQLLAAVVLAGCGGADPAVTVTVRPVAGTVRAEGLGLVAVPRPGGWTVTLDRGSKAAMEVHLRLDERLAALRPRRPLQVQVGVHPLGAALGGPSVRVQQLRRAGAAGQAGRKDRTRAPMAEAGRPGDLVLLLEVSASPKVVAGTWRYLVSFVGPDIHGQPVELELTVNVR